MKKKMLNIINHQCNASKTCMRNHLTPVRMAVTKKKNNNNVCKDMENMQIVQPLWKII